MKKLSLVMIAILSLSLLGGCGAGSDEDAVDGGETTEIISADAETADIEEVIDETEDVFEDEEGTSDYVEYDVAVYDDPYVSIVLTSISSDNLTFDVTNVSDETIQIDIERVALDDVGYTYEDTNYSTPCIDISSGETRELEFVDWDCGNEIDFSIDNPNCSTFSAVFEVWDEAGNLIENAASGTLTIKEGAADMEVGGYAEYDGCSLQLEDADTSDGYIILHATYKNDNEDPLYAYCSFVVKAFQNDTEIEDVSDINGDDGDLITEVMDGMTVDVTYRFELVDDSEVEVMVCTPTADQDVITTMTYR